MKLVRSIVREAKLDETSDALMAAGVSGMTVLQVRGRGRRAPRQVVWRGTQQDVKFDPYFMVDVVVDDYQVDEVVRIVMDVAHSGQQGDGRIFVMPLDEAFTIRTRAGGAD